MASVLIVIPARLEASRLPGKPMADIHGTPMIVHVWRRAMAAEVGRVVVATDTEMIRDAVRAAGGEAAMTRADHASGTDRVFEAVSRLDPETYAVTETIKTGFFPAWLAVAHDHVWVGLDAKDTFGHCGG